MIISVMVKEDGYSKCKGASCKRLPEYISTTGRIKKGTTAAKIQILDLRGRVAIEAFYCRDCLEQIHNDVKEKLNPNLWVFS